MSFYFQFVIWKTPNVDIWYITHSYIHSHTHTYICACFTESNTLKLLALNAVYWTNKVNMEFSNKTTISALPISLINRLRIIYIKFIWNLFYFINEITSLNRNPNYSITSLNEHSVSPEWIFLYETTILPNMNANTQSEYIQN